MLVKEIKGFEGLYTIDEYGNVYSIRNHKYLKQKYDKDGYKTVHLCNNRNNKFPRVHQLVAEAFVPNDDPNNKTTVDHIDNNKTHNHYSNLQWLSVADNSRKANLGRDYSYQYKPIKAINFSTFQEYVFNSRTDCAKFVGCSVTDIWAVLVGKQKTAHGYYFEEI